MPKVSKATPTSTVRPAKRRQRRAAFFQTTVQQDIPLMEVGRICKLPIFYYDNTTMTAIFTASTAKVKKLLPHAEMHPLEVRPGRCMVAFTAFEYRDTDIDTYNEFSISFVISFGRQPVPVVSPTLTLLRRRFEAYIWQLPVTTEFARVAGVKFYGYPKFIGDIDFSRKSGALDCRLAEDGEHILTLSGSALRTRAAKQLHFRTYSLKDGTPVCSNIFMNPLAFAQSPLPNAASLTLGTKHPIAKTLRTLGLSKHPILYQYAPKNELMLFGPRNLMDK